MSKISSGDSAGRKSILLIDDEVTVLKLLEFILKEDYNLVVKKNGLEAISWMDDGHLPDLIISDLEMPYVDGHDFIKSLKTSGYYREIPIILLTGSYAFDDLKVKNTHNCNLLVQKPFNPGKLKESIKSLIA